MNKKVRTAAKVLLFALCTAFVTGCGKESLLDPGKQEPQACTELADADAFYQLKAGELLLVTNDSLCTERAISKDGKIYIPYSVVKTWDDRFYYNEAEEQMIVSNAEDILYFWPNNNRFSENGEQKELEQPVLIMEQNALYVSYELVLQYAAITTNRLDAPARIVTQTDGTSVSAAVVQTDAEAQVRTGTAITYPILESLKKGDRVILCGEADGAYQRVVTEQGLYGYLKKDVLGAPEELALTGSLTEPEYTHILLPEKLQMAWHQVFARKNGTDLKKAIKQAEGINVISPTWFKVTAVDGSISSFADASYVEAAHAAGIQVWALVDDFTPGVSGYELLSSTDARNRLIENLVGEVLRVKADGINIDFEYITQDSAPHFLQFLRELSVRTRKEGLVLSVDNYVPYSSNAFYQLAKQSQAVDYVILMAYDEHHAKSQEPGSVASLPFVTYGIEAALKQVPAEQLVLGIPFYNRVWKTEVQDGVSVVSSKDDGMDTVKAQAEKNGAVFSWDEENGQFYGEYEQDGARYQIWLEDGTSLEKKTKLIDTYQLAGFSGWKLGMEGKGIWELLCQ